MNKWQIGAAAVVLLLPTAVLAQVNINDLGVKFNSNGDIFGILLKFINNVVLVWAGVIAFLYVIWGGFQYLTAGGDAAATAKARATILNAVVGIIIIALSYIIIRFVNERLNDAGAVIPDAPANNPVIHERSDARIDTPSEVPETLRDSAPATCTANSLTC